MKGPDVAGTGSDNASKAFLAFVLKGKWELTKSADFDFCGSDRQIDEKSRIISECCATGSVKPYS